MKHISCLDIIIIKTSCKFLYNSLVWSRINHLSTGFYKYFKFEFIEIVEPLYVNIS